MATEKVKVIPVLPEHVVQQSKTKIKYPISVLVDNEANTVYCALYGPHTIGKFTTDANSNNDNEMSIVAGL